MALPDLAPIHSLRRSGVIDGQGGKWWDWKLRESLDLDLHTAATLQCVPAAANSAKDSGPGCSDGEKVPESAGGSRRECWRGAGAAAAPQLPGFSCQDVRPRTPTLLLPDNHVTQPAYGPSLSPSSFCTSAAPLTPPPTPLPLPPSHGRSSLLFDRAGSRDVEIRYLDIYVDRAVQVSIMETLLSKWHRAGVQQDFRC